MLIASIVGWITVFLSAQYLNQCSKSPVCLYVSTAQCAMPPPKISKRNCDNQKEK